MGSNFDECPLLAGNEMRLIASITRTRVAPHTALPPHSSRRLAQYVTYRRRNTASRNASAVSIVGCSSGGRSLYRRSAASSGDVCG